MESRTTTALTVDEIASFFTQQANIIVVVEIGRSRNGIQVSLYFNDCSYALYTSGKRSSYNLSRGPFILQLNQQLIEMGHFAGREVMRQITSLDLQIDSNKKEILE